ncbi:MAG TPA: phenylalanine--tRNA ligase subunit alpha, partial [Parvularculaceae bacterium]|nr:phenylalanine--tRNA ligase subunit alpha [Parvularculaceae bacterium]
MADIETIERETLTKVADAETIQALEDVRVSALGKKGVISERMKALGKMSPEERKTAGAALNALKDKIALAIDEKRKKLENAELDRRLATEKIDVTLPIAPMPKGRIHPVTQVTEEIIAIFSAMGFDVAEGPDIEDDFHNF